MTSVSSEQIQQMVNVIVGKFSPKSIYLFGSYARGESKPDSDVDLLVVGDTFASKIKAMADIRYALRFAKMPLDVVVSDTDYFDRFSRVPGHLFFNINKEKRLIYGQ